MVADNDKNDIILSFYNPNTQHANVKVNVKTDQLSKITFVWIIMAVLCGVFVFINMLYTLRLLGIKNSIKETEETFQESQIQSRRSSQAAL